MPDQVATANRLSDGAVVYLGAAGTWIESIADASVMRTDDEAADGLKTCDQAMATNEVVDALLIPVEDRSGTPWPTEFREVIRASGPSNRTDLGKQAE